MQNLVMKNSVAEQEIFSRVKFNQLDNLKSVITPEFAKYLLSNCNGINRKKKPNGITQIQREIELGRWKVTHNGILLWQDEDDDFWLFDGQHRLEAILRSNKPTEIVVYVTKDKETFKVIDQGINRSLTDILKLPAPITSSAKSFLRFTNWGLRHSVGEVERVLDSNLGSLIKEFHQGFRPKGAKIINSAAFKVGVLSAIQTGMVTKEQGFEFADSMRPNVFKPLSNMAQNMKGKIAMDQISQHLRPEQERIISMTLSCLNPNTKDRKKFFYTEEVRSNSMKTLRMALDMKDKEV